MASPRSVLALFAAVTVALTGCVPEPAAEQEASEHYHYVQDLWVLESIATLDAADQELDLTVPIVEHFEGAMPTASVPLADGIVFHRYEGLDARMIDMPTGGDRHDVDIDVGFIETADGRALAVTATPRRGNGEPIFVRDAVAVDFTFLEGVLAPGDPLMIDYAFMQLIPSFQEIEAELSGAELMAHRMGEGLVQFYGDGAEPLLFAGQTGMALTGSIWGSFPAKSQPMLEEWEAGAKKCLKNTRHPVKCVSDYFTKFGQGVNESWTLLDDQIEFLETEYTEMWKEEMLKRDDDDVIPTPKPQPGGDRECGTSGGKSEDGEVEGESPDCTGPPPGGGVPDGGGTIAADPHIVAFGGAKYDMHGVGEYVAARRDDIEVQVRTAPVHRFASGVVAAAIRVDEHTIRVAERTVIGDGDDWLTIDGAPMIEDTLDLDGVRVEKENVGVTVRASDGTAIRVYGTTPESLTVRVVPATYGWEGLLGTHEEVRESALSTRDGDVIARGDLTHDRVHGDLSESWRITDAESLFSYAAGESTETFTDRRYPLGEFTIDDVDPAQRAIAERLCFASGIIDEEVFAWCVFDMVLVGGLGDLSTPTALNVVRNTFALDAAVAAQAGALVTNADGTVTDRRIRPRQIYDAFAAEPGPEPDSDAAAQLPIDHARWDETAAEAFEGEGIGRSIWCAPDGEAHPVFGGYGAYSDDSSVCTAAVHEGLLTLDEGGRVQLRRLYSQGEDMSGGDPFLGYEAFGITSLSAPPGQGFFFPLGGFEDTLSDEGHD